MVEHTKSVNNGVGVASLSATATVLISNSTVTGNIGGLSFANGGVLGSYGNNVVDRNGTNGAPSATFTLK